MKGNRATRHRHQRSGADLVPLAGRRSFRGRNHRLPLRSALSIANDTPRTLPPTHPGAMLREDFLPDYGLTVASLAEAFDVSRQTVSELVPMGVPGTPYLILEAWNKCEFRRSQWGMVRPANVYTPAGKPTQIAFIESFNGKFRDECLNEHVFVGLDDSRTKIENWRLDSNANRPNRWLNNMIQNEFSTSFMTEITTTQLAQSMG